VKARGIEIKAINIVSLLKFISTKKAIPHKIKAYTEASFTETFPEAIGLLLVLSTFLSKFLSAISFTMHPADRIKMDPDKKRAE
jgi:hypothetical protein